jgi:hypothetical protein
MTEWPSVTGKPFTADPTPLADIAAARAAALKIMETVNFDG